MRFDGSKPTCPTPDCDGDGRYSAPGRGHREGCHHPFPPDTPAQAPPHEQCADPKCSQCWRGNLLGTKVLTQEEADATIPFDCQRTSDCPCPPNAERIGCYAPLDTPAQADGGEGRG